MNDLENAYDAERDAISADMYDDCEFFDTQIADDELPY
jgi:hypothetical protein